MTGAFRDVFLRRGPRRPLIGGESPSRPALAVSIPAHGYADRLVRWCSLLQRCLAKGNGSGYGNGRLSLGGARSKSANKQMTHAKHAASAHATNDARRRCRHTSSLLRPRICAAREHTPALIRYQFYCGQSRTKFGQHRVNVPTPKTSAAEHRDALPDVQHDMFA